ncbi:MAG: sulfite exporter TauE/SafE family protein [Veillonellales bacterium]
MITTTTILLLITSFAAGFIDSISGGGGLLLLPALLISGLPPQTAIGTNKFTATLGLSSSLLNFIVNKKIDWQVVRQGILPSLAGSLLGAKLLLLFSNETVGKIILVLLPLAIGATLWPHKQAEHAESVQASRVKVPAVCLVIGFYDGFFGPGSGSILLLALYLFVGLDLVKASATTKAFSFLTCLTSVVVFFSNGIVLLSLGLLLAAANIAGNFLGSKLVMQKGTKIVKACLAVSLAILFASLSAKYLMNK